jgi:hypothetical protein
MFVILTSSRGFHILGYRQSLSAARRCIMENGNEQFESHARPGEGVEHHHGHHHPHHEKVTVTVDGKSYHVPEGTYVVSEFKKLVGVAPSKELDEVVHGELKPLDDNQTIHIKGGEVFISHARQGGSS